MGRTRSTGFSFASKAAKHKGDRAVLRSAPSPRGISPMAAAAAAEEGQGWFLCVLVLRSPSRRL